MVLSTDAFDRHIARPFLQRIKTLRGRVAEVVDELDRNAQLDQYPSRRVPQVYTRRFGPITGPIVCRNNAGNAQENTGTLVDPSSFVLPMTDNIQVGRDGRFVWTRSAVHAYMSLTWASDPGDLATTVKAWGTTSGDLFDDVVQGNGGGMLMDQFGYCPISLFPPGAVDGVFAQVPPAWFTLAWRLGLYDKKRDRYLHDGDALPSAMFTGLNKNVPFVTRFDEATEIEPRLYIDEFSSMLNFSAGDLAAVQWKAWLVFSMAGYLEQGGG